MDCRILVVDNEKTICELIKESITSFCKKSRVDTCHIVRDALHKLECVHYDQVISDLGVGNGYSDGGEILRTAKELGIFTVVCSGSLVLPHEIRELCDFVLPKPFSMTDFERLMDAYKKTRSFLDQVSAKYQLSSY
jgi:CheY-like chemotaxis protein